MVWIGQLETPVESKILSPLKVKISVPELYTVEKERQGAVRVRPKQAACSSTPPLHLLLALPGEIKRKDAAHMQRKQHGEVLTRTEAPMSLLCMKSRVSLKAHVWSPVRQYRYILEPLRGSARYELSGGAGPGID